MLSLVFCTTRHWQISGSMVQELNCCTLPASTAAAAAAATYTDSLTPHTH